MIRHRIMTHSHGLEIDEYVPNLSQPFMKLVNGETKSNVDTLMRLLQDKIKEKEQRIREKRQKKERERQQMMKERIERRVPTPTIGVKYQQRYKSINTHNMNVMNAAKNAVLAKKNQFIMNKNKQLMNDKKKGKSRWDDKK